MKNRKEKEINKILTILSLFVDKKDWEQVESLATSLIWDLSRFDKWKELVGYLNIIVEWAKKFGKDKK